MSEYPATDKIYIKDSKSVIAVWKAQKPFMDSMKDRLYAKNTFITFGRDGLIVDIGNGIRVRREIPIQNQLCATLC